MLTKLPNSNCPACNKSLDACGSDTHPNDTPREGDITYCIYCGQIMSFNEDLTLRKLTEAEFNALDTEARVYLKFQQKRVRHYNLMMNARNN